MNFDTFFRLLTASDSEPEGRSPYPYQMRLAETGAELVEIQTGLGKTEAVVAAWLWGLAQRPSSTPRRLIYSLPMRSLVEQTATRIDKMLANLERAGISPVPNLHVVMGGDVGDEWFEKPEEPAAVVGTQDLLLSRALNRGYAMSRFQWPMTFGAINNDVLWVIDEVQLQGVGAVTAAQLQGLREKLGAFGITRTVFMSATLDRSWLDTVDHSLAGRTTLSLNDDDWACESIRRIVNAPKTIVRLEAADEATIARAVAERHRPGTLTLVVVNTVDRARTVHRHLQRLASAELVLLHSRFRPADRKAHVDALFAPIEPGGLGRIVVSTQVVEAGIDVDAATLVTDVAPWSSIVQRLGRCNRRGGFPDAVCYWIDSGEPTEKSSLPYAVEDVQAAREQLLELQGIGGNGAVLPKLPIKLESGLVLRRVDLLDLFDTSSDLSGHDIDVSRFIREADDFAANVFWRDEPPADDDPPFRDELCPASLSDLHKLLKKLAEAGRRRSARIENQFGSYGNGHGPAAWVPLDERSLRPGLQIWLEPDVAWYDSATGFGERNVRVDPVSRPRAANGFREECTTTEGDRGARIGVPVTLSRHALDTAREAQVMGERLAGTLGQGWAHSVAQAALWHDVGKAHEVFQDTMTRGNAADPPSGEYWAKCVRSARHKRRGFRHELASTLAFLNAGAAGSDANLVAFLIAAHHGKLRLGAQLLPTDVATNSLLGNRDGELVPAADLGGRATSPAFYIDLSPFQIGASGDEPTWVDRVAGLRDDPAVGPFRLAYLELLVRLADWRASRSAEPVGVVA
ncbi:MAG: CRISPR-associated endonuclease Cas3'' [Vulcanimicrobiaceae bacterium]